MVQMSILVDGSLCIGCGLCCNVAPAFFQLKKRVAHVREQKIGHARDMISSAQEACPMRAIKVL